MTLKRVPAPAERLTPRGTVMGRRMWTLERDRERWRLGNLAHATDQYWPRGVYEADCENWRSHSDRGPSPHPSCNCGLYAFWDLKDLREQYSFGNLTGIVEAWGRIRPGDEGFLARYMLPIALDWPVCGASDDQPFWDGTLWPLLPGCTRMATNIIVYPTWTEPYPAPYAENPEGYDAAWRWVNLRASIRGRCEEHLPERTVTDSQGCGLTSSFECDAIPPKPEPDLLIPGDKCRMHSPFVVPTADVMRDLERFYECDIITEPDPEWTLADG